MKLPRSVKIAGQTIKLRVCKLDAFGQYEHDNKTIFISNTIKDDRTMVTTLRHEMLEASLLLSGVGWMDKYEQEAVVRCVDEIFWVAWESLKLS